MIKYLDFMFGFSDMGRFIYRHFKFVFCIVYFTYLIACAKNEISWKQEKYKKEMRDLIVGESKAHFYLGKGFREDIYKRLDDLQKSIDQ